MIKRIFIFTALLIFTTQLFGGIIEKEITFKSSDFTFTKSNGYDAIFLPGEFSNKDIGSPMLPEISVKLLIPPGATAKSVEIISSDETEIPGEFDIIPVQQPVKISSTEPPDFVEQVPDIYNSNKLYPGNLVSESIHNGTKCGYRIASFSIYPMQYIPSEKQLILYKNIRMRLSYDEGEYPIRKVTERQKEVFGESVKRLVMNIESIEQYSPPVHQTRGPYGDWQMVIIAPNNSGMIDEIEVLANWKTQKGVPCMVKNVQDIYNNYSGNNPWKIKQFINDMVSDSGTIWVMLFGDSAYSASDGIACRGVRCWAGGSGYNDAPVDRYFEDLDNDWNDNNNSVYGEHDDGPDGNELDWYADCYLGRAFPPAGSATSAKKYVDRIIWFEKTPDADFTTQAIFSSCQLFPSAHGYVRTDDMASYIPGGWYMPGQGNGHPGFEFNQGVADYPGDASFLSNELSDGYQFYGTCAHGHYSLFMGDYYDGSQYITSTEVSNYFDPDMRCGIFTANSCLWGGFDQMDCCAEFLYHYGMTGGACNSREGWGYNTDDLPWIHYLSDGICWQFFVQIFNNDVYHLGEVVAEAKDYFAGNLGDDTWNWCLKEYNTFGDPELTLWNASTAPLTLQATHASVVPTGSSTFDVNVTDGSKAPVNNALVCLWCETETSMYVTGYTNSSGDVSLSINPSIDGDIMQVTATKHNYLPYEGSATVDENVSIFLTSFTAVSKKQNVEIQWETESEINNSIWIIERAKDISSNWGVIANIPGQGTKPTPTEYSYLDDNIGNDGRYYYRLIAIGNNGNKEDYGPISVFVRGHIPNQYALHKVHPSPSSDRTTIYYDIPKRSYVNLKIYNTAGRLVRTLLSTYVEPGYYSILWDGCNKNGNKVANGTYFLRMNAEQYIKTQKLLFVK